MCDRGKNVRTRIGEEQLWNPELEAILKWLSYVAEKPWPLRAGCFEFMLWVSRVLAVRSWKSHFTPVSCQVCHRQEQSLGLLAWSLWLRMRTVSMTSHLDSGNPSAESRCRSGGVTLDTSTPMCLAFPPQHLQFLESLRFSALWEVLWPPEPEKLPGAEGSNSLVTWSGCPHDHGGGGRGEVPGHGANKL